MIHAKAIKKGTWDCSSKLKCVKYYILFNLVMFCGKISQSWLKNGCEDLRVLGNALCFYVFSKKHLLKYMSSAVNRYIYVYI